MTSQTLEDIAEPLIREANRRSNTRMWTLLALSVLPGLAIAVTPPFSEGHFSGSFLVGLIGLFVALIAGPRWWNAPLSAAVPDALLTQIAACEGVCSESLSNFADALKDTGIVPVRLLEQEVMEDRASRECDIRLQASGAMAVLERAAAAECDGV